MQTSLSSAAHRCTQKRCAHRNALASFSPPFSPTSSATRISSRSTAPLYRLDQISAPSRWTTTFRIKYSHTYANVTQKNISISTSYAEFCATATSSRTALIPARDHSSACTCASTYHNTFHSSRPSVSSSKALYASCYG